MSVEVDRRFRGAYCLHNQGDEFMMEAVRTSETSLNFNVITRRYIPEDSKLHFEESCFWTVSIVKCFFFKNNVSEAGSTSD
jgi:hypothetical protein